MNTCLHAHLRGARIWRAIAWALFMVLAIAQAAAAQTVVDLQLVLAVDASGSVDQVRFELQKRGYVAAFRHARVLQAIRSGPNRAIGVTMVQWTGPMLQVQVVGWTLVADEETATAFADAIERAPRQLFGGGTSISGAIDYAMVDPVYAAAQQREGRLRILAVSTGQRLAANPDWPTMTEQGIPMDLTGWWAAMLPSGTPKPIVDQVNKWFTEIVKTEESKKFLNSFGGDPFINSPEAGQALFLKAIKDWGDYVRIARIEPQ